MGLKGKKVKFSTCTVAVMYVPHYLRKARTFWSNIKVTQTGRALRAKRGGKVEIDKVIFI